jgi:hypothetical protein
LKQLLFSDYPTIVALALISSLIRFFVEDDRMSNRESESMVQKQKQDRLEIEEFYTNVREAGKSR